MEGATNLNCRINLLSCKIIISPIDYIITLFLLWKKLFNIFFLYSRTTKFYLWHSTQWWACLPTLFSFPLYCSTTHYYYYYYYYRNIKKSRYLIEIAKHRRSETNDSHCSARKRGRNQVGLCCVVRCNLRYRCSSMPFTDWMADWSGLTVSKEITRLNGRPVTSKMWVAT